MKKILITGAGGFIGKACAEFLEQIPQYEVIATGRNQLDLCDAHKVEEFLKEQKPDVILHCANRGGNRKNSGLPDVVKDNLRMFFHLERCLTPDIKLINIGSGAQYKKDRDLIKISEDKMGEEVPEDDYGFSKYVMSKYIKRHNQVAGNGKIYNLILFGVYGRGEDYTFRFISNAILKNLFHLPITIRQDARFDYLWIEDFCRILEAVIENDWEETEINCTPTQSVRLSETAALINQISDYQSGIQVMEKTLNYEYTGDNRLLNRLLPEDFIFTSYEDGIRSLYEYYKKNLRSINREEIQADSYLKNCKTKERQEC